MTECSGGGGGGTLCTGGVELQLSQRSGQVCRDIVIRVMTNS